MPVRGLRGRRGLDVRPAGFLDDPDGHAGDLSSVYAGTQQHGGAQLADCRAHDGAGNAGAEQHSVPPEHADAPGGQHQRHLHGRFQGHLQFARR